MTKPRLLDLFSGAGGAAVGYHRAGFEVVGVDIQKQPRYPFAFIQGDAMDTMRYLIGGWSVRDVVGIRYSLKDFAAIHASPPCQRYSRASRHAADDRGYPDLIKTTRRLLEDSGVPFVIENVIGAPLESNIVLCGVSFGLGEGVWFLSRHRQFECSVLILSPGCPGHPRKKAPLCIAGHGTPSWGRERISRLTGRTTQPKALCRRAMGIDWMTWQELTQAIPPAYTEFIGLKLIGMCKQR